MCGETEILAPNLASAIDDLRQTRDDCSGFQQQFQVVQSFELLVVYRYYVTIL